MTNRAAADQVSGPDAEYETSLKKGRFRIQRCNSCSEYCFPPRALCPACNAHDLEWRDASGTGSLHAFTIVRRADGNGGDYNVALVDLKEGPRMMSRVDDVALEDLKVGMILNARCVEETDGTKIVFGPGNLE